MRMTLVSMVCKSKQFLAKVIKAKKCLGLAFSKYYVALRQNAASFLDSEYENRNCICTDQLKGLALHVNLCPLHAALHVCVAANVRIKKGKLMDSSLLYLKYIALFLS